MKFLSDIIYAFRHADGPPPDRLLPFLRWALDGAFPAIFLMLGLSIATGLTEVAGAAIIGWVIDAALARGPEGLFPGILPGLLGVVAFFLILRPFVMGGGAAVTALTLQPNIYPLVLSRINRHVLGHSLSYFDDDFAGRIAQKAQQTSRATTEVVTEICNTFGFAISAVIGAATVMALVSWQLGVILALWVVGYVFLIQYFLPRIRSRSKARAAARAVVTGQIVDTVSNIATVKLFAHGAFEDRAALDALSGYRDSAIGFGRVATGFRFLLMTLAGLLPVALISASLWFWSQGTASAGDIAAAGLISTRLAQMSGWVSMVAMGVFANIGEIEDGIRTLSPPHRVVDRPDAQPIERARGAVNFEHVRFGYGRKEAAIEDLSLHVSPGEKVALVGRSGAGKSTLVSLLLRLYDTEAGRITLDGTDIRDLTQDGLRAQIGMVRQETSMFNRSALENIRYGRPNATDEEVIAAAKRAEAHDFILGMRDFLGREGYDAHLGERGVKLSGGQRQRIALARVILKNAPVLVLDEATSALDSEVEAAIQGTLETVMEGKTVIAIAHRLSTIARMDRIVVLDGGRIAEEGSHAELLDQGGLYAGFWDHQSGGFINLAAE
ncbi:ABC transporter ATP-binding protein [Amaricoccus macauensis]|uniref:ABC transporter ATP-binding protein n=1 Tax=Amaricoccus macauensis TaxID=57001 RepID=UPI003C7A8F7F